MAVFDLASAHYHNSKPCWGFACAPGYEPILTKEDKEQMDKLMDQIDNEIL